MATVIIISNTLSHEDTALWRSNTPEGQHFRREYIQDALSASYAMGTAVEIYADTGYLLESVNFWTRSHEVELRKPHETP